MQIVIQPIVSKSSYTGGKYCARARIYRDGVRVSSGDMSDVAHMWDRSAVIAAAKEWALQLKANIEADAAAEKMEVTVTVKSVA